MSISISGMLHGCQPCMTDASCMPRMLRNCLLYFSAAVGDPRHDSLPWAAHVRHYSSHAGQCTTQQDPAFEHAHAHAVICYAGRRLTASPNPRASAGRCALIKGAAHPAIARHGVGLQGCSSRTGVGRIILLLLLIGRPWQQGLALPLRS